VIVISEKTEIREALRAILSGAQHDVVEAADAGVGLSAYRTEPADAVFVDVVATGRMKAADFIRQIRREFPDVRVVAMSARSSYGVSDPLAVARQLGAVRTIRVPCSSEGILNALEEARQ
jgi:DNA-binding NtrC family response regulator